MKARHVFITGGVASSLGKGVTTAALGALLQARGFKVCLRKLDPYLNVDPGTMNPIQHGEVYVTQDGVETDLDIGHYERFTDVPATKQDSVTAGRIYQDVIARERKGLYNGGTVQVVPHVTNLIKKTMLANSDDCDFILCEIGGTVGDIESLPFLEAARQLKNESPLHYVCFVHLTLVPFIRPAGELKTKPTQHSVKELRSIGIQPDILVCRCEHTIPKAQCEKLSTFCNVRASCVIEARDTNNIYALPLLYNKAGFDEQVLEQFNLSPTQHPANLEPWEKLIHSFAKLKHRVRIGIICKYGSKDAYMSLREALTHAGLEKNSSVDISWIDAESLEGGSLETLHTLDGILVPGGFGVRGSEGKIEAARYARETKKPFLGLCLGMQIAIIETARNLLKIKDATSTEFDTNAKEPIIGMLHEWIDLYEKKKKSNKELLGASMRLGNLKLAIKENSRLSTIYGQKIIEERHRHRYEVNQCYVKAIETSGLKVAATSLDGLLVEAVEIPNHPWYVGVQYHPELLSRPFKPHPLFLSFIEACLFNQTHS